MNVIISFAGLEDRQNALKSRRPFALQPLAASTILGHILERLKDVPVDSITVVVSTGTEQVGAWTQNVLSDDSYQVVLVNGSTPMMVLRDCERLLNSAPLLYVAGDFVTEANYAGLADYKADAICLIQVGRNLIQTENWFVDDNGYYSGPRGVKEVAWAGVCWFRRGTDVLPVLADPTLIGAAGINPLLSSMKDQGMQIGTMPVKSCFGTGSSAQLLHANARLMSLGYCSEDAIERSYSDEFTVLPPVFLHETAVVEKSVIGPFVNLEANAVIRNSVVSNSLIGVGALVQDAVLESSIIGDQAQVIGQKQEMIVGDESQAPGNDEDNN